VTDEDIILVAADGAASWAPALLELVEAMRDIPDAELRPFVLRVNAVVLAEQRRRQRRATAAYAVGQRVVVVTREGDCNATVTQVNTVTLEVLTEDDRCYRVSPEFVAPLEPAEVRRG
jgi:hypothetical protein